MSASQNFPGLFLLLALMGRLLLPGRTLRKLLNGAINSCPVWPSQNSAWVSSSLCPPVSSQPCIHRGQAGSGPGAQHNAYQVALGKMCSPFASGGQATSPCCPQPNLVLKETGWCESGCGHTAPDLSVLKLEAQGGCHFCPLDH